VGERGRKKQRARVLIGAPLRDSHDSPRSAPSPRCAWCTPCRPRLPLNAAAARSVLAECERAAFTRGPPASARICLHAPPCLVVAAVSPRSPCRTRPRSLPRCVRLARGDASCMAAAVFGVFPAASRASDGNPMCPAFALSLCLGYQPCWRAARGRSPRRDRPGWQRRRLP